MSDDDGADETDDEYKYDADSINLAMTLNPG